MLTRTRMSREFADNLLLKRDSITDCFVLITMRQIRLLHHHHHHHHHLYGGISYNSKYYCNSLLYGITDGLLQRLQSVQNAAARLVTGARRSDHIAPVLRCGSCTGCQFVSESRSRSRGLCISRWLVLLRRILLTTVIFCLTLVVAR